MSPRIKTLAEAGPSDAGEAGRRAPTETKGSKVQSEPIDIDVAALAKKYAEERAKRLRTDGTDQFLDMKSSHVLPDADPWSEPLARAPIVEETEVLVIGGGFAGLLAGANLRKAGIDDFRIVEKGADFGGTWYWNRYPGASCDVESYIYLPLLEELGYLPSEKYARRREIHDHCVKLANHFDLYKAAIFQTQVTEARWHEGRRRWIVRTSHDDEIAARFIISCTGLLANPKLPRIPGIESFKGKSFHTSRWDYGYTGGDEAGNLTGLANKAVGIIGTGATGIQAIPFLARSAKHLYVLQRTPASIDARNNRPTDPEWGRTLEPGWQRKRSENFTVILSGGQPPEGDLVDDGWTDIIKHIPLPAGGEDEREEAAGDALTVAGMRKMEMVRRRIDKVVKDPKTAESLKPYFHYFCKRPGFHDEYLEVFNRDNVTLVDTDGKGVERVTPDGVVAGGREIKLDCLIYATGFDWMADYFRESGIELIGRAGVTLGQHWNEGPRTLFGMQTHGFPNLFFMRVVQAGASFNFVHTADEQTRHIAYIIRQTLDRGATTVEVTKAAEDAWVAEVVEHAAGRLTFLQSCTPGYYNFEGANRRNAELNELYGPGPMPYYAKLEEWRADGRLPGLELSGAPEPAEAPA
jgi:cyclohexanone monooxygenase